MIMFCCASELGAPKDLSAIEVILLLLYTAGDHEEESADGLGL